MAIFARPLVALSLSGADGPLLQYATHLAALGNGCEKITFLHVLSSEAKPPERGDAQVFQEWMRSEVTKHAGSVPPNSDFQVLHGSRLDQILALCIRQRHDLVLLGHRASHSGRRSLARRLAMVAPCSVWLVPEGAPLRISNILIPVDFSSHSADALSLATSLAAGVGLKHCQVLHVFFDPSTVRDANHIEGVVGQQRYAFGKFLAEADRHGVAVDPLLDECSHPAESIMRVARRQEADLIVMSTRGRSRSAAVLLGSVTSNVMAATTIPLLAVKHFGSHMTLVQALLNHETWEGTMPKTN